MTCKEFEAKNLDEAIALACKHFSLPEEELEIEILSKGASGIFGLMRTKNAKILAKPKHQEVDLLLEEIDLPKPKPLNSLATIAKEALEKILSYFDLEANVTVDVSKDCIYLNIEGDGSGILIGRRGQTLNALQHITNKIVNKAANANVYLVVDSENYRQRREDSLRELAEGLAKKAQKLKKPIASTPLNSHDRRVIHMALRNNHELRTKSKGEGFYRRVLVYPQKVARD